MITTPLPLLPPCLARSPAGGVADDALYPDRLLYYSRAGRAAYRVGLRRGGDARRTIRGARRGRNLAGYDARPAVSIPGRVSQPHIILAMGRAALAVLCITVAGTLGV